jgi:hypothetical protein
MLQAAIVVSERLRSKRSCSVLRVQKSIYKDRRKFALKGGFTIRLVVPTAIEEPSVDHQAK